MIELFKRLKPFKKHLLVSIGCLVLFTVLGMLMPLVLKNIIDRVIPSKNEKLLFILLGGLALLYGLRQVFFYLSHYLIFELTQKVLCNFRKELFTHLQNLSLKFHDNYRSGKLISNLINDVQKMQMMINQGIIQIFVNGFSAVFISAYLFYLDWKLALISLSIVPLYLINFVKFNSLLKKKQKKFSNQLAEVSANLNEVLSNIRVVKSLASQPYENKRFYHYFDNLAHIVFDIKLKNIFCSIIGDSLYAIGLILTLGFGTWTVWNSTMTIGEFVGFYSYVCMVFQPIIALSNLAPIISEGLAGLSKLNYLLNQKIDLELGDKKLNTSLEGKVAFKNVSFAYKDKWIVQDFNLNIEPGETVAFVGSSGSGKSTISNLLLRFYEVGTGSIEVDHVDIRKLDDQYYRDHIGVVLQEPMLFSGTIMDNIRYAKPEVSHLEVVDVCKMANAHEFIMNLDNQYQTEIGEKGVMLSGGQKQRLAIARTLLRKPKVLILDEATSALDNHSEVEVQKALDQLQHRQTTIVIAHRLTTIQNADKIVVLHLGQIQEIGNHEQLMSKRGHYYNLYQVHQKQDLSLTA